MDKLIAPFANVAHDPYERLKKWKAQSKKKIIGCFPMYVPEEIIHAAGMLPITVMDSEEAISQADRYMMTCTCHVVRSTFDLALKGEMDFLDGVIFPDICEPVQLTADIWKIYRPAPFHHNLTVPMNLTLPSGKKYLIWQFENLRAALEKFSGKKITDQAIKESIVTYNRNRTLMNRLYEFRRNNPASISAKDMAKIVTASMLMPKEEHSQLLEQLLVSLKPTGQTANGRVKIVLSGSLCDRPEPGILDILDEIGAVVIDDDLYCGSRYFTRLVDETLPPIEGLAERYIEDVPCPTKHNPKNDWARHLLNIVGTSKADAVVLLMLKYCEPHAHDEPYLKEKLTEAGIPHLSIETDTAPIPLGQIRTKLQALVELVGRR